MTDAESNTQPPQRARSRVGSVMRITGAVIIVVLVVAWFQYPAPQYRGTIGHHVFHLLPVGWVGFLSRTLPGVTANGSALALAGVVALLLAVMLHRAGRWLTPRWAWRSTLATLLVPALLFIIAMGASGAYMRVVELSKKEGRWKNSMMILEDLRQIDEAIDAYYLNTKGETDFTKVENLLQRESSEYWQNRRILQRLPYAQEAAPKENPAAPNDEMR